MAPSTGSRYMICLIAFIDVVTVKHTYAKLPYGSPCTTDSQCKESTMDRYRSGMLLSLGGDNSRCYKGKCDCTYNQIRLFTNNNYECRDLGISGLFRDHCQLDDPNTCINGTCEKNLFETLRCICSDGFTLVDKTCREILSVDYAEDCKTPADGPVPICDYDRLMHCKSGGICDCFSGYFYDKENKTCILPDDYAERYPEEVTVNLNDPCESSSITSLPKLCNKEDHMSCEDKKCKCTRQYYPVESNKTCESKKSYAEAHNLTSYKVMPGIYCSDDSECITGLDCFKKKCACPHPCTFDTKTTTCDCGEVSIYEGASHAMLVGVIGGFIIIAFWVYKIKKTIREGKLKSKRKEEDENDEPVTDYPPDTDYSLIPPEPYRKNSAYRDPSPTPTPNPAPARSPPPSYATTVPDAPAAPFGFYAPTPSAPTGFSAPTPSAPTGFSAPTPSAPEDQQPPYTEPPTVYPLSPVMPPASNTSPSTIPYPDRPVPPYDPTSASIPSFPATDVNLSTTAAYPYSPVAGVAPDYVSPTFGAPTYSGGDASAPPPYTPTTHTDATAPPAVDIYKPIIF